MLLEGVYAKEWENAGDGQSKFEMLLNWLGYGFEFQYVASSKTFRLGKRISRRPAITFLRNSTQMTSALKRTQQTFIPMFKAILIMTALTIFMQLTISWNTLKGKRAQ